MTRYFFQYLRTQGSMGEIFEKLNTLRKVLFFFLIFLISILSVLAFMLSKIKKNSTSSHSNSNKYPSFTSYKRDEGWEQDDEPRDYGIGEEKEKGVGDNIDIDELRERFDEFEERLMAGDYLPEDEDGEYEKEWKDYDFHPPFEQGFDAYSFICKGSCYCPEPGIKRYTKQLRNMEYKGLHEEQKQAELSAYRILNDRCMFSFKDGYCGEGVSIKLDFRCEPYKPQSTKSNTYMCKGECIEKSWIVGATYVGELGCMDHKIRKKIIIDPEIDPDEDPTWEILGQKSVMMAELRERLRAEKKFKNLYLTPFCEKEDQSLDAERFDDPRDGLCYAGFIDCSQVRDLFDWMKEDEGA